MFFRKRFDRFKKLLDKNKIDAYLETKENNIFYLTGFKGSSYPMLFTKKSAYIFLPEMLYTQCLEALKNNNLEQEITILIISPLKKDYFFPTLKEAIQYVKEKECIKTIFSSTYNMNMNLYRLLENIFIIKDVAGIVENMRMIKDELEIQKIKTACYETYIISQKIPDIIKMPTTEFEVAKKIDIFSVDSCGEKAFDTIVAFGQNTAFPHYVPKKDVFYNNEIVMVDFGTKFEDYCSDITRMFFVERTNDKLKEIFEIVRDVQNAAIDMVKAGIRVKDIDLNVREMFSKFDFEKYFIHSTGHGVGLDIHEAPGLNKRDDTVLKTGMVITIEPGIYINGIGGVRIEDTVLVTDNGCKILTRG